MWRVHASVKLEKQRQWLWWLQLVRLGIGSSVPWTVSSKHCRLPLQTLYVRLDSDPAYNPEVHVQQSVCEWYDKNSLIKFGAACMHVKQRKPWNIFTKYDSLAWQAPPPSPGPAPPTSTIIQTNMVLYEILLCMHPAKWESGCGYDLKYHDCVN